MHFAPLPDDDKIVKKIPNGKVITVEAQKEQLDKEGHTIMATGLELPGNYGIDRRRKFQVTVKCKSFKTDCHYCYDNRIGETSVQ